MNQPQAEDEVFAAEFRDTSLSGEDTRVVRSHLRTGPNGGVQPLIDRRAMLVSKRNFVKVLTGGHRSPLLGQIQKSFTLLRRRSILRQAIANPVEMMEFSLVAGHDASYFQADRMQASVAFGYGASVTAATDKLP